MIEQALKEFGNMGLAATFKRGDAICYFISDTTNRKNWNRGFRRAYLLTWPVSWLLVTFLFVTGIAVTFGVCLILLAFFASFIGLGKITNFAERKLAAAKDEWNRL